MCISCVLCFMGSGLATHHNSLIRVTRREVRPSILGERSQDVPWTTVSRLLSAPEGLLFNLRSRYSLRYRTRDVSSLGGVAPPVFALHSQAALLPPRMQGATGLSPRVAGLSRPLAPSQRRPATARARPLPFRSPLLREPPLLSLPELIDMLKFSSLSVLV